MSFDTKAARDAIAAANPRNERGAAMKGSSFAPRISRRPSRRSASRQKALIPPRLAREPRRGTASARIGSSRHGDSPPKSTGCAPS